MRKARFEWDEEKEKEHQAKHGVSFATAQQAFLDPHRVIAEDINHNCFTVLDVCPRAS